VVRTLLLDAIDYAGLFPPAQLDMPGAVAEYASYLESNDAWALGRFVVPATRLEELAIAAADALDDDPTSLGGRRDPWRLSALLGADIPADMERVQAFNAPHDVDDDRWWGRVQSIELRASTLEAIAEALRVVPADFERFVEIPVAGETRALVRAIGRAGGRAKIRTGGTTVDAFPTSVELVRFLAACVTEHVPFKATAGLHHPLRGDYPLTYAADSERSTMYGFLNVFLAAALLHAGESEALARQALEEQQPTAFHFDDNGIAWCGRRVSSQQLLATRELAMRSFGSCSFREPLDDLASLGLL
jgi:hypothetical protein